MGEWVNKDGECVEVSIMTVTLTNHIEHKHMLTRNKHMLTLYAYARHANLVGITLLHAAKLRHRQHQHGQPRTPPRTQTPSAKS